MAYRDDDYRPMYNDDMDDWRMRRERFMDRDRGRMNERSMGYYGGEYGRYNREGMTERGFDRGYRDRGEWVPMRERGYGMGERGFGGYGGEYGRYNREGLFDRDRDMMSDRGFDQGRTGERGGMYGGEYGRFPREGGWGERVSGMNEPRGFMERDEGGPYRRERGLADFRDNREIFFDRDRDRSQEGRRGFFSRAIDEVKRRFGRGPKTYRRSDERIREDIHDRLIDNEWGVDAGDVEIKVKDCEVILTGTVNSREDKRMLEDIACSVLGVTDVHNQLRVVRPEFMQQTQNVTGATQTTTQPRGPQDRGRTNS